MTRPLRGLLSRLRDLIAGIREAREMQDRYDRLARLSDSELKRLGLDRQQIAHAVVSGHPRLN
jgi:uncharacterized protein YjiS (DUF1127 family)